MSAIAKREPSILDLLETPEWPRAVLEVVRRAKVPKGCTDEEFYVFMRQAQLANMNPILGQCFCVPRRTNVAPKGEPAKWVTNHVFQVAIDGMRSKAGRHPDFMSTNAAAVWEADVCKVDPGSGEVSHTFTPGRRGTRIIGAWGRVEKKGCKPVVTWLEASSRSGSGDFWTKDFGGMLALGAERLALRKAYPTEFEGVPGYDEPEGEEPQKEDVVEAVATVLPAAPEGPVCLFDPHKGRSIAGMTPDEVRAAIAHAEPNLASPEAAKWSAKTRAKVEQGLANLRAALPPAPALPAPGLVTDFEVVQAPEAVPVQDEEYTPPEPTQEELDAEAAAKAAKKGRKS